MTDDSDRSLWFPPAMFTEQMQEAGEQVAESQQELMKQLMQAGGSNPFDVGSSLGPMNMGTATFKARVQSGGRISIPGPEREALDIEEGDIVQTIVVPVKRNREKDQ
ncbi:AbrB/MazE/SpoVT family DNA-binding domain-containing protein [Natronolimnohabitans sp. A-GB9]|uniref:AbrB/MazE/SpoVT family DNA-binding domain-containing protein n=1 Tax=Natronolimnohabitans sp. A-GB9 TaxID=3069757 RepID=UPI0027B82678|nr:AbrB/MazE/SpoVT family DNA-binding domain-containing protein [Natronolimnohabitans sp. A-GB9]MDQ2051598.1 AbrB/MazE/SpoVT family DNA-binding domain-containing protein [Natronolimnohabitans sp. A-GB9]